MSFVLNSGEDMHAGHARALKFLHNCKIKKRVTHRIFKLHSPRWNYLYSVGTSSVVLELPHLKIGHYLLNDYWLVEFFYTAAINKDSVYHVNRGRLSFFQTRGPY